MRPTNRPYILYTTIEIYKCVEFCVCVCVFRFAFVSVIIVILDLRFLAKVGNNLLISASILLLGQRSSGRLNC